MTGKQSEWFHHSFKDDYLFLYSHRAVREATRHISLAIRHVPFEKGQHILDLACGAGRHALAFARRGAIVTGVDLSSVLLKEARTRLRNAGQKATFKQQDMRELSYRSRFDGVSMWFTSFGYFESPKDDFVVLKNIEQALKAGGWWWIDIINPDHLRANIKLESSRQLIGPYGPAQIVEGRKITSTHVIKTIEIADDKGKREYVEKVRLYSPAKFEQVAKRAGLNPQGVLGNYRGESLSPERPRQIWFGLK
jgi:ubiquinone/menaquinone biosynthesis C-methylase UbiE